MKLTPLNVKLFFLGLFLMISAGLVAYEYMWAKPRRECEADSRWWNEDYKKCFRPVEITSVTKRKGVAQSSEKGTQSASAKP